jgi:transglutaminase-like putative cysteine protease
MSTAATKLMTALTVVLLAIGPAPAAEDSRHFEGPYHVSITPLKRVHATVSSTFRYPQLDVQEWWAAIARPPIFEGQPQARFQAHVAEAPLADADPFVDESALRQPLVALHWFSDGDAAHTLTTEAEYEVTITRRILEPGAASTPVHVLPQAVRSIFLAATAHFDFSGPKFQSWLRKEGLRREPGERDLDFAYRAMQALVKTHTYRAELWSNRTASAVCAAGWADCGGLATIYVSIMRANGIPARCLSGRSVDPNTPHVKMEFYADGVGWVPADPAVAIGSHRAGAGFGRDCFDMIITHFDVIRINGKHQWMQGTAIVQAQGTSDGGGKISFDHSMRVEILPLEKGATASALDDSDSKPTGQATKRFRNRR